jgi:transposase InsO family protein
MTADLVTGALDMAIKRRKLGRGFIFHSGQCSQYAATVFRKRLWVYGIL